MKRYVRRAAFAALLAAPVLAVPVWTASAASARPGASTPSCPLPGQARDLDALFPGQARHLDGRVERLIGNLSPAAGSSVAAGAMISFLIADERPFHVPLSRDVVVTVNGAPVTATAGAQESGVPITYASRRDKITYASRRDKGSQSTNCEVPFSFALPSSITGSAHIRATAHDGDGGRETVSWTLTVQATTLPNGAVGGLGLAAVGGLVLTVVQVRRRRGA